MKKETGIISLVQILLLLASPLAWTQPDTDSLDRRIQQVEDDSLRLERIKAEIQRTYQAQPEEAVRYAHWYEEEAAASGNPRYVAYSYNFLGITYYAKGDIPAAIEYYLRSYRQFETLGDSLTMGILLNNIGAAYEVREKAEETVDYYERALAIFQSIGDQEWIAICQNNLANQYFETDPAKSLEAYQTAYRIHQELGIRDQETSFLANMANCYLALGDYPEAIRLVNQALPMLEAENDQSGLSRAYQSLGRANFELEDFAAAEQYFLQSWEVGIDLLDRKVVAAESLGEVYKEMGDYAQALAWQEAYMTLKDSLFNRDKDAQMTRLLAEFEAENKDQAIRLLTTENELRRRRNLMLGIVTSLLLVIVGLVLLLWLSHRRKSQQLASKNADLAQALTEKETLMQEIHHRVKNNLQVIASLLRLQGRRLSDSEARTAIEASQARLEAISLIHQFLYRDTEVAQVDLKAYLETLLDQLERLYESTERELQTSHEIDAVNLDIEAVLPISLIVNELLTNAFKYAPQGKEPAQIHLGLKREAEGLRLTIQDNGPGYDPALHRSDSLGLRLVRTFVDRLSGKLDIQAKPGTTVNISLPWNALAS